MWTVSSSAHYSNKSELWKTPKPTNLGLFEKNRVFQSWQGLNDEDGANHEELMSVGVVELSVE